MNSRDVPYSYFEMLVLHHVRQWPISLQDDDLTSIPVSTALVANKRHRMNAVTLLFARVDGENLCLREDTWTALMVG